MMMPDAADAYAAIAAITASDSYERMIFLPYAIADADADDYAATPPYATHFISSFIFCCCYAITPPSISSHFIALLLPYVCRYADAIAFAAERAFDGHFFSTPLRFRQIFIFLLIFADADAYRCFADALFRCALSALILILLAAAYADAAIDYAAFFRR